MNVKFVGWAAVSGCIFSVGMAVLGGRESTPQTASAASYTLRVPVWSHGETQACQAVINRMSQLRHNALAAKESGGMTPMAAVDYCIAGEAQIDISRCPSDFRLAVARYIAAENSLSADARINAGRQANDAMAILMHTYAHESVNSYGAPEELQGDLTNLQNAQNHLDLMAAKYCAR